MALSESMSHEKAIIQEIFPHPPSPLTLAFCITLPTTSM